MGAAVSGKPAPKAGRLARNKHHAFLAAGGQDADQRSGDLVAVLFVSKTEHHVHYLERNGKESIR